MVLFSEDDNVVEWKPAVMPPMPEFVWPWSTWVGLRRKEEQKEPHNMMLLMQHAYARCPLIGCWEIRKLPETNPEELPTKPPPRFERHYRPRNYVSKHKNEKTRFIIPRFKNIPARIDSNLKRFGGEIKVTDTNQ